MTFSFTGREFINIFWPMFAGVLRILGVNYPEKIGVNVGKCVTGYREAK